MKILAVSHSCVTDVNQALYVALNQISGVQVELVVPANWKSEYTGQSMTPQFLPGVTFPIHALPAAVPGHNSLHFYRSGLARVVQNAKADVVFIDEEPWSLAALQAGVICRRFKTPFVCYTKQNILKKYPLPFSWIEQTTYQTAAAIVALSEEVASVLGSKGFGGECPLLAHACDLSLFHAGRSEALRTKLGLDGFVIGFMGRFVPEKGGDTLMAALSRLAQARPQANMSALLVGSGAQEEALKQASLPAGMKVVFSGSVPHTEAAGYLRCMDVLVVPSKTTPSWKEQFGRVIIEAMACEIPVVGSDSGYIPQLIQNTGGGFVFAEGDEEDLAAKLLLLVDDPQTAARLGRAGADCVREQYTYPSIAHQLHQILRKAECR